MIYGYIRTSRAAVDGLAGAGVEPANIVSDVGVSGSVPISDRPGWTGVVSPGAGIGRQAMESRRQNRTGGGPDAWPCVTIGKRTLNQSA